MTHRVQNGSYHSHHYHAMGSRQRHWQTSVIPCQAKGLEPGWRRFRVTTLENRLATHPCKDPYSVAQSARKKYVATPFNRFLEITIRLSSGNYQEWSVLSIIISPTLPIWMGHPRFNARHVPISEHGGSGMEMATSRGVLRPSHWEVALDSSRIYIFDHRDCRCHFSVWPAQA